MNGPNSQLNSHSERAYQYALDVVSGQILACKWTRLACQRHIDDIARTDSPYAFDSAKADRVCKFIELLPHVSGKWAAARELIRLEPWQCFIVCSLFGWLKAATGKRRFSLAYICIPRKNAKSTLAAAIALYCLVFDGEHGAQVYCGAGTEQQAHHVFDPARQMVLRTPKLSDGFGVVVAAKTISVAASNSFMACLIGKPGDGGSPSLAIVDEFHEHLDSTLLDTMITGAVAREQPLTFIITTAGSNIAGPCHTLQQDIEKTLDGILDNPDWFGIIYGIDPEDDWASEMALRKANPNLGVSVSLEHLQQAQRVALQSADKQNNFKTKHLDVWCNAASGYFDMTAWASCYQADLSEESFAGEPCILGLDLAAKLDLCAAVKVFTKRIDDQDHFYIFPRAYLPEAQTEKPENQHYQKWVHKGHLTATPGSATDYQSILDDILRDTEMYRVRELCFDQREATFLTQLVENQTDAELVEIQQRTDRLSEPLKWLQSLIITNRIHHNGDPVMTWCISNVIAREDANENVFPRKAKPELKIDAVAALLNALVRVRSTLTQAESTWTFKPFFI